MKHEPKIETVGPPPTRHAERLAAEMTRWLIEEQFRNDDRWGKAIESRNDGNPKAQHKMVERLKAAGGTNLFWASLYPGNRKKYELRLYRWVGWSNGGILYPGDPIPERPWIACLMDRIVSTYSALETSQYAIALIPHHAIARLAERCGARTAQDIILHARSLSKAVLRATAREEDRDGNVLKAAQIDILGPQPPGGWRIPYPGGIAVLRLDAEKGLPIIATVLGKD